MPNYRPGTAQGGINYSYLYNEPGGTGWVKKMIAQAEKEGPKISSEGRKAALANAGKQEGALQNKIAQNKEVSNALVKSGKPPSEEIKQSLAKSADPFQRMGKAGVFTGSPR